MDFNGETLIQSLIRKGLTDPEATRRERNTAILYTLRPQIEQALANDWTIKAIWERLTRESRVRMPYSTFRRYVHRKILKTPTPR